MERARIVIGVFAHNEERRIGACLASLPLGEPEIAVHVIVDGSSDRTARVACEVGRGATVHDWPEGGKARSWNRFLLETPDVEGEAYVFVDGDAEVTPGSIRALVDALRANPGINAASGLPCNGRGAERYRAEMAAGHGLFGDLYALSGSFVGRLRATGLRLPEDLIGDDSLIGAMAKTDLADESDWVEARVQPVPQAGFLCEPTRLTPASLRIQYRRMIAYSVRGFQNRIITASCAARAPRGYRHVWRTSILNG